MQARREEKKSEEEKGNTRSRGRAAGRKPTLPSAHSAVEGGGGSWARCTGRLQEARRHEWQCRDSNLDLHSIITFTSWTKDPEWRMAGLGTRVRGLGCGEGVLFGNYLGIPPDPASVLPTLFQRLHVDASDRLMASPRVQASRELCVGL